LTNNIAFDHLKVKAIQLPKKMNQVIDCRRTVRTLSIIQPHYHLFWPIEIIIKPDTIPTYQRVFTFLLQTRRTSHTLSHDRLSKDTLTHTNSSLERAYYYSLRARLLWFQQILYYYLTAIVLESLSIRLRQDLREAEDVDSMITVHSTFIKMTQDQALLGSKLTVIHKTILKILDLAIKLQDAQTANALASKEAMTKQQELMDLSMGSLGLHTPKRKPSQPSRYAQKGSRKKRQDYDLSSEDDDDDEGRAEVADFSILSPGSQAGNAELPFGERLRKMMDEFDRMVRFVASGLRGVARAGGGEEGKSWGLLGEMLEAGIGSDVRY
jgi:gamma-tubulin complex component 5